MIAESRRSPQAGAVTATLLLGFIVALSGAVVVSGPIKPLALGTLFVTVAVLFGSRLLAWRTLLLATLLVILFVPIRRYELPGNLPFQLEAYRVLIALVVCLWLAALLIDPRVRFLRSFIQTPLLVVFVVSAASIVANISTIENGQLTSDAVKQLTFLASFVALFFLLSGLGRTRQDVDYLLKALVIGGAIVSIFSLIELRTGFNVFNHIDVALPFLTQTQDSVESARGGYVRVVASSQHPIALGAMFVLLIPLAFYLYKSSGRRGWLLLGAVLGLGTLTTGSRTAIVMLVAVAAVYLVLRPRETFRFWPALLPLMVVVHVAMPGVMGSFYKSFFPEGGLVAEQADAGVGSSRVASFGPAMEQVAQKPLLGSGFGARSFHGEDANSFIVDDQWLSTAMETGVVGVAAWLWLFLRFLRRTFREARRNDGSRGWFFTGMSASCTAFAVGMLTYDAFSFIQTTLVLFVLLGLTCAWLGQDERRASRVAI